MAGGGGRLTEEERDARLALVRDAIAADLPAKVLAAQIGISPFTLTRWAARHGVPFPHRGNGVRTGQPVMTVAAAAAANRETGRVLHPRIHREPGGWELHCERCERTPVRVYPSKARAEKARQLHDRCCEGVDTTIRGQGKAA